MNRWAEAAKRAGLLPEVIERCKQLDDAYYLGHWIVGDGILAWRAQERRSDMRTVEYELWQTEEWGEDEKGKRVRTRKEERIGEKRERFMDGTSLSIHDDKRVFGSDLLEILQDHLEEIANAGLKLADVEVRARPFPV
jgi:hypothetical protein